MTEVLARSGQSFATMYDAVRYWAARAPDAPALFGANGDVVSYGDLLRSIDAIGNRLNALGIGRPDRVAILHPGGAEMAAAVLGVWSRATAAPLNPNYTIGEFAVYLRDLRVKALAIAENMDSPARLAADRLGLPTFEIAPVEGGAAERLVLRGSPAGPAVEPDPPQPGDVALLLTTSGTTAHSKIVPIRHRQLIARCRNAARRLELTPDDRSLNLMPLYHSHGLNSGLGVSIISGSSVLPIPQFDVESFFRSLETLRPTWFTAVFTFHHRIHAHAKEYEGAIAQSRLRFIHTSSGRLEPRVASDLEEMFGVPMIGTYATTETGVIAGDSHPPALRKRGSVGTPACDSVAVVDADGLPLPAGQRGEVCVRGDNVFDGYENDIAVEALTPDGWFKTGDEGMFDADGFLFLTGRVKETINRGGEKISPTEVDAAILKHPDVVTATTFPIPHATLGEEVAAAVVLKAGSPSGEKELRDFVLQQVTGFKAPRRILIVDDIPKGPTGKIQRHALAAAFGLDTAAGQSAAASPPDARAATPLERQLQALWAETLGQSRVGLHDDFFLLGGDSLQAVELFLQIEKSLGRRLPRAVLFEASTVAEMARHIEASSSARCLVPVQPQGNRPALFCVHDIYGHVLNFRALAQHLDPSQPLYGLQLAGLDGTEAPLARIEDMATRYLSEMRTVQPAGPYYLAGYSMGGLIAYEIARKLRASGETVAFLALFDTFPRVGRRQPVLSVWFHQGGNELRDRRPSSIVRYVAHGLRNIGASFYNTIRQQLFGMAWRFCECCLTTIPRRLHRPSAATLLALRSYRMTPYEGDAVLFTARPFRDDRTHMNEDWRRLIQGKLDIRAVSGQHHEILEEPHVKDLAQKLAADLVNAQRKHGALNDTTPVH